jgi:hypothetical protein
MKISRRRHTPLVRPEGAAVVWLLVVNPLNCGDSDPVLSLSQRVNDTLHGRHEVLDLADVKGIIVVAKLRPRSVVALRPQTVDRPALNGAAPRDLRFRRKEKKERRAASGDWRLTVPRKRDTTLSGPAGGGL